MIRVDIDYEQLAASIAARLEPQAPWMTVAETAEYCRASESWVRARLHEIPHVKVDGKTLLDRRQVDDWLNNTNHRREN